MLVAAVVVFDSTTGSIVSGLILGLTSSLIAVSISLIWRSHRVISFAQSDLGMAPATLVVMMMVQWSLPYWFGLLAGSAVAILAGIASELLVMRRFANAPRMIATVATLGIGSVFGFASLVIPRMWGQTVGFRSLPQPFEWKLTVGQVVLNANDLLAAVICPLAIVGLASFVKYSPTGMAIRAAADRGDRASMLGISVGRLHTQVWAIAGLLSFLSVYLTAGVTGLGPGFLISFTALLQALAALVLGRMDRIALVAANSVALGVLNAAMLRDDTARSFTSLLMLVIIGTTLLAQRAGASRHDAEQGFDSQSVADPRPLAPGASGHRVVQAMGIACKVLVVAAVVSLPWWQSTAVILKAGVVVVFAVIGLSVVVLTGWAGQVSFGQMAFVGAGGAFTAWAIVKVGLEPITVLVVAAAVGAVVAVIVGLPALRLNGLYLAVITLGLALAANQVLFSNAVWAWIPLGSFDRPALLGRFALSSPTRLYLFAVAVLAVVTLAVRGLSKSRVGRTLRAIRDNESAAMSFGISVTRAKLLAFGISGAIASIGGSLLVLVESGFRSQNYDVFENVSVFSSTVIGGMSSPMGAVLGALYRRGAQWLLPGDWQILATAFGLLLVTMLMPTGLVGLWVGVRDGVVRWVIGNRLVPDSVVGEVSDDS